ncbi:DUF302 domain-containing protein [Cohnella soli]|uniref:DUF302 domain-containing protein n=1 Tax=Cohnella soli TaxID=425005 RepID=A0ABW0HP66_9BACL
MNFHYTVESDLGMNETIEALGKELKKRGFGVLWDFDLTAKLKEKGQSFDEPYRILEVCNPAEAARILSKNELAAYFLPCKIVVYEKEGKTRIGLPKPTALIEVIGDEGLKEIAVEVEKTLVEGIDQSRK